MVLLYIGIGGAVALVVLIGVMLLSVRNVKLRPEGWTKT